MKFQENYPAHTSECFTDICVFLETFSIRSRVAHSLYMLFYRDCIDYSLSFFLLYFSIFAETFLQLQLEHNKFTQFKFIFLLLNLFFEYTHTMICGSGRKLYEKTTMKCEDVLLAAHSRFHTLSHYFFMFEFCFVDLFELEVFAFTNI